MRSLSEALFMLCFFAFVAAGMAAAPYLDAFLVQLLRGAPM